MPSAVSISNEDYRVLAQRMTAALCRKRPSPFTSGQPRTWACGIVYVLGQVNFLTDPSTQPFMTTADLCSRFGVGQSTASYVSASTRAGPTSASTRRRAGRVERIIARAEAGPEGPDTRFIVTNLNKRNARV